MSKIIILEDQGTESEDPGEKFDLFDYTRNEFEAHNIKVRIRELEGTEQAPEGFKPGKYQHYRGRFFTAIALVQHHKSQVWYVLYHPWDAPVGVMSILPWVLWNQMVTEQGACKLNDINMHTHDDCTKHQHEPDQEVPRFKFIR